MMVAWLADCSAVTMAASSAGYWAGQRVVMLVATMVASWAGYSAVLMVVK